MDQNIHRPRAYGIVLAATLGLLGGVAPAAHGQTPTGCPTATDSVAAAAWQAYHTDSLEVAAARFAEVERSCPAHLDARNGQAFVRLRHGDPEGADSLFRTVVARDSANADAWDGLARVAYRRGDLGAAQDAGRRALTLNARNDDLRALLAQIDPDWERPPAPPAERPALLQLFARTRGDRFEVRVGNSWRPLYVQGVNLGVALPGRFPAEFPVDSGTYAGWIEAIAGMHANAIRVYTILPPAFYRALRGWNEAHPEQGLYLIHGVWTELPPEHDFDDAEWKGEFRAEMRRVVDLVHGAAAIPPRPGHAGGRYDADVSRWVLAYIIGREWEPYAIQAYTTRHSGQHTYHGRYLAMAHGSAADAWMAEQCDVLLAYEMDRYHALRPIAYTNWPTLDPLHHPTESTTEEERQLRHDAEPAPSTGVNHEEDVVTLDATLVRATTANPAGWFASYHAYPYYPDFINYDPKYSRARSSEGASNYFGYLVDLKRYHSGLPLLIAEFGVPSSRGIAHLQPQGWHHGGHDEAAMAAVDARLAREIHESGAAGGIVFAWMDEWFKRNWIVANYQIPADHTPRWHNAMNAEQHYGLLGHYAGRGDGPVLGGDSRRWIDDSASANLAIQAHADEAYVYLGVRIGTFRGRAFPWDSLDVLVALDTYGPDLGQKRLPGGVRSEIGFEFLADLRAPDDAELQITPDYNPYVSATSIMNGDDFGRFYHAPAASVAREDGQFDSLFVITNRARYGRDGTFFPARGYNRGRLRYGTQETTTLADWYYDRGAGVLQLRLPWGLLNVTDPSTRTVLAQQPGAPFATAVTEGFRIGVLLVTEHDRRAIAAAPDVTPDGRWTAAGFTDWQWPTWVEPTWHSRLKPAYDSLKTTWGRTR